MPSKKLIYSTLLLLIPFIGLSQQDGYKWRVNAGTGNSYNQWDLSGKNGPSTDLVSVQKDYLTYQLSIERLLGDAWGTELMVFSLPGTFDYREVDLLLNYYTDNRKLGYRNRFISPFLSVGVGRDQIDEEITLPYGGGLKFRVGERLNLNIEYLARVSPSDWTGRVGVASLTLGYNFKKRKSTFNAPPIYASSSTNYLNDIVEPVYLASDSSGQEFLDFDTAYMLLMDSVRYDSLKGTIAMTTSDLTDSVRVKVSSDSLKNTWISGPDSVVLDTSGGVPSDSVQLSMADSTRTNNDFIFEIQDPKPTDTPVNAELASKTSPTALQPGQSATAGGTESVAVEPVTSTATFETMPTETTQTEYVPKYQSTIQASPSVGTTSPSFNVLPGSAEIPAEEVTAYGSYTALQTANAGMFASLRREQDSIKQFLSQQIEIQKLQVELSRIQSAPAIKGNDTEAVNSAQRELNAERNAFYLEKIAFLEQKLIAQDQKAIRDTIVLRTIAIPAQQATSQEVEDSQQLPQPVKLDSVRSVPTIEDTIQILENRSNTQLRSRVDSLQYELTNLSAQILQLKSGLKANSGGDTVFIQESPKIDQATKDELSALKREIEALKVSKAPKPSVEPIAVDTRFDEQLKVLENSIVYFETNSYQLSQLAKSVLEPVSSFVLENPSLKIMLAGYTDKTGSPERNQLLSKRRAEAVANYFRDKGITSDRISITFHGPDSTSNESPAHGRRVEIQLN